MNQAAEPDELFFGEWHARRDSGELSGVSGSEHLEPKVMELLLLLGSQPNQVISREAIMQRLWPRLVVGEDTLARAVFKLRKSLGDDARHSRYIETIPKRGYRFIYPLQPTVAEMPASVSTLITEVHESSTPRWSLRRRRIAAAAAVSFALLLGWSTLHRQPQVTPSDDVKTLTERANDFYFQYSRVDNEAAIELFERVVAVHPEHAPAYAGLANAIAQREVRWPDAGAPGATEFTRLGDALKHGHTRSDKAQRGLLRAAQLAERAVQLAPRDAAAHKALGFVRSVREDFPGALAAYGQAVVLDPDAWGAMINIGDILQITGQPGQALPHFESAFAAMTRVYPQQTARIRPWYAELAMVIGERHQELHHPADAERWYRRTLDIAPFHPKATARLAALLREGGRNDEAEQLCGRLRQRVGADQGCVDALARSG